MNNNTSLKSIKSGKKFSDFCFVVLLSLLSLNSFSQNIRGTAMNIEDKTFIPNLPIFLKCNDSCYLATQTDVEGNFNFNLNLNSIKSLILYAKPNKDIKTKTAPQGFFIPEQKITINKDSIKTMYVLELWPIPMGLITLPSFQFKQNSLDIKDSILTYDNEYSKSVDDLNWACKILNENPNITFEFDGHCSTDEKNPDELSLQRAEKIKQLLVDKGIEKDRLTTKGWGIKKLKITTAQILKTKSQKEKDRINALNRRVVLQITEWWYTKTEEKPLCN
ncbi:MAG TPA: OmpA family protein [Bacteroidia bacterium]|nr:OmpA family protein [Bacteroidia bacterium]